MKIDKLVYNAAAHFAASEIYPDGVLDAIAAPGEPGFCALCWAIAQLSTQAELIRRDLGHDPRPLLTPEQVKLRMKPSEIVPFKMAVYEAIMRGLNSADDDDEIDEVLAELQKKKGQRLTEAQYLAMATAAGFSRRDAMLTEISVVCEVLERRFSKSKGV